MDPVSSVACVSGYRFIEVEAPQALADDLRERADLVRLRGTVLVAGEGVNFMLAGTTDALQHWLAALQDDPRFAGLPLRWSTAPALPFGRLRVKVKREIIRMDQPAVRPAVGRAPAVAPATLARWLQQGRCDEGRPLALLDTRNAFEVDAGAFDGALDWRLRRFGEFPSALAAHAGSLAGHTVVSYCTGGIRCEKAALWMQAQGVAHVHQLDGGILGYFEATGDAPGWVGRCVVFDERGALAPDEVARAAGRAATRPLAPGANA